MTASLDLRIRLILRERGHTYRQDIALTDLSDAAKKLLHRLEPRIIDPAFYALPLSERTIDIQARTMLEASGNLERPEQPHPNTMLLPELSSRDRRFEICAYGNPRHTETYLAWLDGCARAIEPAFVARRKKRDAALRQVDDLIDRRLLEIVGSHPSEHIRPHDDTWIMDWGRTWMAHSTSEDISLKQRLRDRVFQSGCTTMREFLLKEVPGGRSFVEHADMEVAPSFAIAM